MGISYELLPTADIYLKYRSVRAKFNKGVGSETIDRGGVIGVSFSF
jgi:hypothetical protein